MKKFLALFLTVSMLFSCFMLFACEKSNDSEKTFTFVVVHADGTEKSFDVTTTKTNVGDALLDEELISGDNAEYGLYVKTVDGVYAEYTETGAYWSFYIGEEVAMSGVSGTAIEDGATYKMVYTKAE